MTIDEIKQRTDVPVIAADHDGQITFVNDRFTDLFKWEHNEMIGKNLTTIIPPNLHDAHHLGFSRFVSTGKPTILNKPLELPAITKSGSEIKVELIISAEKKADQWVFVATIKPL